MKATGNKKTGFFGARPISHHPHFEAAVARVLQERIASLKQRAPQPADPAAVDSAKVLALLAEWEAPNARKN